MFIIIFDFYSRMLWRFYAAEVNMTNGAEDITELKGHKIAKDTYERNKVNLIFLNKILITNYCLINQISLKFQLIIPPLSLEYGVYKLTFTARMWDPNTRDPHLTQLVHHILSKC